MSLSKFSDVFGRWTRSRRHDYTRMRAHNESNGHAGPRTSFVECLEGDDAGRFESWPNFTIEDDYRNQHDQQSLVSPATTSTANVLFPSPTSTRNSSFAHRVYRMSTRFPIRDMSWATGFIFTIGSAVFVTNGFFLILPTIAPHTVFNGQASLAAPISSLTGGIIFVIGGWTGYLEALNLNREGRMTVTEGVNVDDIETSSIDTTKGDSNSKSNTRMQKSQPSNPSTSTSHPSATTSPYISPLQTPTLALIGSSSFIWNPSLRQLKITYRHSLPFLSALTLFIGTLIFLFAIMTGLPGVLDLTNTTTLYLGNLFPGTLGGLIFTISSLIATINTQDCWYILCPRRTGWWVGAWSVVGSIGFTLASALPFIGTSEAAFQASLASWWGSCAFLVGSWLQWYVAMERYP